METQVKDAHSYIFEDILARYTNHVTETAKEAASDVACLSFLHECTQLENKEYETNTHGKLSGD